MGKVDGDVAAALAAGEAREAVDAGIATYFAQRRAMVDGFADANFSLSGAFRLHRAALGWDVLRAPANLSLALPQVLLHATRQAAGKLGAGRLARALEGRSLLLKTAVVREVEWRIMTQLLELPFSQAGRESRRDALAETILAGPHVTARVQATLAAIAAHAADGDLRARLETSVASYAETRAAAAEITTGLLTLSSGAVTLQKLTPGAVTLGPALATALAQQAAVASFPLGSGLGGVWYGMFPAAPSAGLVLGLTGGLMLTVAAAAAFAGLVADPVQYGLGLHQRRLRRMLDALERQMREPGAPGFAARDRYVARLMDVFDMLGAAARALHV